MSMKEREREREKNIKLGKKKYSITVILFFTAKY
jgi:hypothetical protein